MRITLEQCCRKDGRPHWHKRQVGLCQKCLMPFGWMRSRYRSSFFDQVGHQEYEQPPQSLQNLCIKNQTNHSDFFYMKFD